jgi:hypothetical protein
MDIATMALASVERDSLVLIAQFNPVQMIVCPVELALTTLVFVHLDGPTLTAR